MYSRKAFERLGFQVASEFLYSDYEVEGEKVFEKIQNHRGTAFMTKSLVEVGPELLRFLIQHYKGLNSI